MSASLPRQNDPNSYTDEWLNKVQQHRKGSQTRCRLNYECPVSSLRPCPGKTTQIPTRTNDWIKCNNTGKEARLAADWTMSVLFHVCVLAQAKRAKFLHGRMIEQSATTQERKPDSLPTELWVSCFTSASSPRQNDPNSHTDAWMKKSAGGQKARLAIPTELSGSCLSSVVRNRQAGTPCQAALSEKKLANGPLLCNNL